MGSPRRSFWLARQLAAEPFEERHAGVFDIIGKRNWFFAFSLLIMIPGLIFLLLGPVTGGKVGLQFAIDFTGGTVWSIRFEDGSVTPQAVKDVIAGVGTEASVTQTGDGYMEIRTREAAVSEPPRLGGERLQLFLTTDGTDQHGYLRTLCGIEASLLGFRAR